MLALFCMLSTFFINVYISYTGLIQNIWQKTLKRGTKLKNNQGIWYFNLSKSDYRSYQMVSFIFFDMRVCARELHSHAVFRTHLFVRESKNSQEDVRSPSPRGIHPPKAKTREPPAAKAWLSRASCNGGSEATLPVLLSTSIKAAWFVCVPLTYPPVMYNFPITQQKALQVTLKLSIGQRS